MYEHRTTPLISKAAFFYRIFKHFILSSMLVIISISIGILGYHEFEAFSWLDSLLNASMIMGGMGPVNELKTIPGKIFASIYALYCGLVFVAAAGIILLPLIHRLLHRFHFELNEE